MQEQHHRWFRMCRTLKYIHYSLLAHSVTLPHGMQDAILSPIDVVHSKSVSSMSLAHIQAVKG
jgi:hypothetical protein